MLAAWLLTIFAAPPTFGPGLYRGEVLIPTGTVTVALTVRQPMFEGHIDIPAQGLFRYPISSVVADGDSLRFALPGLPGDPRFTLRKTGQKFSGIFSQGSRSYSAKLDKVPASRRINEALVGLKGDLQSALRIDRSPGIAYAIVLDGARTSDAIGVHGVEAKQALTSKTPFALGNLTRTFVAVAVAQQVELGRWNWSTRVNEILPGFRLARHDGGFNVTLRDLLTANVPFAPHSVFATGLEGLAPDVVLARIGGLGLRRRPGGDTAWPYVVLGQMLAWPPGTKDGQVAMTESFLNTFALPASFEAPEPRARAHLLADRQVIAYPFATSPLRLADGLFADVETLGLWLQMHLNSALLKPRTWRVLRSSSAGGWTDGDRRGRQTRIAQSRSGGTSGTLLLLPNDQVAVAVLANRSDSDLPTLAAYHIADRLSGLAPQLDLDEALKRYRRSAAPRAVIPRRVAKTRPAHPLKRYVGRYAHPAYGDAVIERRERQLKVRLGPLQTDLRHWHFETFVPTGPGDPRLPKTPWTFVTDVRGRVVAVDVQLEPEIDAVRFERTK